MAKEVKLLQPQYAARFKCIGPSCEDDCCHQWNILIDKKTYRRYRECSDLELRSRLDKCVARNRNNPADREYAKIKMDSEGRCPFQDADRLCTIQRTLGEDYLSDTCFAYPRTYLKVNNTWEMALHLSCPEAARCALLNSNIMEFDYVVVNSDMCTNIGYPEFNADDVKFKNKAERYFWPLRIFVITLLQTRNYPLWERLVLLGFLFQKINGLQASPGEIPAVIAEYTHLIAQHDIKKEMEAVPAKEEIQINVLRQLLEYRLTGKGVSPQFLDCFDKIKAVLEPQEGGDQDRVGSNYKTAYETYYRPFMADREYILENYLVNYVFKNAFPFGPKRLFDDYILLIVHYAIIKMMLIGLAGYYKENFSEDHVVQLIYSFSRAVEHHPSYIEAVHQLFVENNLVSMAYMAIFIRN